MQWWLSQGCPDAHGHGSHTRACPEAGVQRLQSHGCLSSCCPPSTVHCPQVHEQLTVGSPSSEWTRSIASVVTDQAMSRSRFQCLRSHGCLSSCCPPSTVHCPQGDEWLSEGSPSAVWTLSTASGVADPAMPSRRYPTSTVAWVSVQLQLFAVRRVKSGCPREVQMQCMSSVCDRTRWIWKGVS